MWEDENENAEIEQDEEEDEEEDEEDEWEDEDEEEEPGENVPTVTIDGIRQIIDDPWDTERVGIEFPAAENGYQTDADERAPLGWVNSATINLDRKEDSVTLNISVGDPRGAFAFTVRRLSDGRLMMYLPTPDDGLLHMPLTRERDGVYRIGH